MFSSEDIKSAIDAFRALAPVGRAVAGVVAEVGLPVLTDAVRALAGQTKRFDALEAKIDSLAANTTARDALHDQRLHKLETDVAALESAVKALHARLDVMTPAA